MSGTENEKSIIVVGDLHGHIKSFEKITKKYSKNKILCVGDLGLGFKGVRIPVFEQRVRFFHGNHDCPSLVINHPNGLDRFGVWENIFYVSGALSIDAEYRTAGIDWWPDEQLNLEEMDNALELYKSLKPQIVATHDIPRSLYEEVLAKAIPQFKATIYENSTAFLLEAMFNAHQPQIWIAGHFHVSYQTIKGNTKFVILDELETFSLDETKI